MTDSDVSKALFGSPAPVRSWQVDMEAVRAQRTRPVRFERKR
jgi:hypothetical protein